MPPPKPAPPKGGYFDLGRIQKMKNSSKLLINESPLQVLPSLAILIGLNEAIFLQQLHYWLTPTAKYQPHYRDWKGESLPWIYNTYHEKETVAGQKVGWEANFPFWSTRTIRRIVTKLKEKGLIIVTNKFNTAATNKTQWYTINYEALENLDNDNSSAPCGQVVHMEPDNLSTSNRTDCPHHDRDYTETTQKVRMNTPEEKNLPSNNPQSISDRPDLSEQEKDELMAFGIYGQNHPSNAVSTAEDELRALHWEPRSPDVRMGLLCFIEAIREVGLFLSLPRDKVTQRDWEKSIGVHVQNYSLDSLKDLYVAALKIAGGGDGHKGFSVGRPGSLTNTLPTIDLSKLEFKDIPIF
jgi:hypothetical protein